MIPHWQFVENVVAALESFSNAGLPGLEVTPKAMIPTRHAPDVRREVDVLVEFRAGSRTMRIGVDVKAEATPLDIVTVESLWAKAQNLDLDRFAVVSLSGYTANATAVYAPRGIELLTIEQVTQLPWSVGFTFQAVHRTVEFKSIVLVYPEGQTRPSKRVLERTADLNVTERDGAPCSFTSYLAKKLGEGMPLPAGAPPQGSVDAPSVTMTLPPELRAILSLRAGKMSIPVPTAVVVSARLIWETREYPASHFRSGTGDELVSASVELPGWGDGLAQISVAMERGADGQPVGLGIVVNPAKPRRTVVEGAGG